MRETRALLFAVGATRCRAAVVDSARVVAAGGSATVVVDDRKRWQHHTFADQVLLIDLVDLGWPDPLRRLARLILYRIPGMVIPVVATQRMAKAYELRVADRVGRRLERWWGYDQRLRALTRRLGREVFDVILVTDPESMPAAAQLASSYATRGVAMPRICFGLDDRIPAATEPTSA